MICYQGKRGVDSNGKLGNKTKGEDETSLQRQIPFSMKSGFLAG